MQELAQWDSFYEIVGSAAGALIGLQFVVMTLVAQRPRPGVEAASAAFSTPTIVHFGTVLFLAALLRAPWRAIIVIAGLWGLVGVGGIIYTAIVGRRLQTQTIYQPQFEDWLFHLVVPFVAYSILVLSAFVAPANTRESLFGVGTAVALLLFVGIHNAWDSVAYHVFVHKREAGNKRWPDESSKRKTP